MAAVWLLVAESQMLDASWLQSHMIKHGCTYMQSVPSLWKYYLSHGFRVPSLRYAMSIG